MRVKRHRKFLATTRILFTASVALLCWHVHSGQVLLAYFWQLPAGQTGNWSNASNWGGVEPTSIDDANIVNGGTVTIDQADETAWILRLSRNAIVNQMNGSLIVKLLEDGGGPFTYNLRSGSLSSDGISYSGTINQTGGTLSPHYMEVGGGHGRSGFYMITNGVLETSWLSVGSASLGSIGAGTMVTQDSDEGSPLVRVTGPYGLTVGGSGDGMLNLSGGTIDVVTGPMTLGDTSKGTVNQTDGLIRCTGLYLGQNPYAFASYNYNLDGGTLSVSFVKFGPFAYRDKANFNLGGGTLQASGSFSTDVPMKLTGINGNANIDTAGFEVTLAGKLSGIGGLNKWGLNTLIVSGSNDYAGPTFVNAGTLELDGSLASTSRITVHDGATLSGIGTASEIILKGGGHIAPGKPDDVIGTLQLIGNLTLDAGAGLEFDLANPSSSDLISLPTSTLVLNGQQFTDFDFSTHASFGPGTYTLVHANSILGNLGTDVAGQVSSYSASLFISGGNLQLMVVPEPVTLLLVIISFCVFITRRA